MHVEQLVWSEPEGWSHGRGDRRKADLVLYFGSRRFLAQGAFYDDLRGLFPDAHLMGCSTGGQILNNDVDDDKIAAVALSFESTTLRTACKTVSAPEQSRACGEALGRELQSDDLAGVFVLSDGLNVNGSELVAGITSVIGRSVPLTGGLAGDGPHFQETLVGLDRPPCSSLIAAVAFCGSSVRVRHGCAGGWDVFGPRRRVTHSMGSVLLELDGEPALDLYERYLGDEAKGLPGTGLLFPLQVRDPERPEHQVVRTVLSIDRRARSMTFAGDVPEGWIAQLMRGNLRRLAVGAADAARQASFGSGDEGVALLVSCIGRRLLMGQRVTEEVDAVGMELGSFLPQIGFYSYGEISPHAVSGVCELHNQTMTITVIREGAV